MRRPEVERMRALLVEAITTLCRSGLQYNANLKVEGLIGITLDEADIILVNLNKTFGSVTDPDLSPTKSLRDPDKSAVYEDSVSDSSFCQEPESPRHNSQDRKRRTDLASRKQAKKARMSPTREHAGNDSEANKQLNIANTFSLSSPEKVEASSESRVGEQDSIPSASSAESALTVPTRTEQQPQSSIEKDSTPKKISRGHDRPIVKIEIDSDPEVEEVKVEPGPLQTFSAAPPGGQLQTGTEMLPQSTFTSDLSLSQTLPSVSSADYQGEVLLSQLPPEFAAVTGGQSDSNPVPVGMFSNARAPMPGPSGLSQTVTGATPYVQTDLANPVDASGQKNKGKTLRMARARKYTNSKERQAAYRRRRDENPERKQKYRDAEKKRYHTKKASGKVHLISDLSEREKRQKRKKWRTASKKYRDRNKGHSLQDVKPLVTPKSEQSHAQISASCGMAGKKVVIKMEQSATDD